MINANTTHRPYGKFITRGKFFRCASLIAMASMMVGASSANASDDEPLSALGVELGLELYDRDVADRCILGHHQIRVNITNVSAQGIMKLELFGEENFMRKSGKLRIIRVPAEDEPMRVCINVYGPGEYAVVGYHDIDGDRKLDKKWNFTPKEPYGLSNNPKIESLRLPKWEETKFYVPENGIDITMNLVDLTKD